MEVAHVRGRVPAQLRSSRLRWGWGRRGVEATAAICICFGRQPRRCSPDRTSISLAKKKSGSDERLGHSPAVDRVAERAMSWRRSHSPERWSKMHLRRAVKVAETGVEQRQSVSPGATEGGRAEIDRAERCKYSRSREPAPAAFWCPSIGDERAEVGDKINMRGSRFFRAVGDVLSQ